MSTFSFIDDDVLINGLSSKRVATTLKSAGVAETRIGEILGWWYIGANGQARPAPFDFQTDVQEHDPNCEVTYEPGFVHTDWVDGEDRVQATATPEELGFNARFHAIENEFAQIRDQMQRLGTCARELRADLVGVVRELESKLTALQNDLVALRQEAQPDQSPRGLGVVGTVKVGNKDAFITQFRDGFRLVEFAGATLGGTVRPDVVDPGPGLVFDPDRVRPGDLVDVVADLEDVVTNPSIRELVERPEGVTVGELRARVGGLTLPGGVTLASVIATMPADTTLQGVTGTVETIAADMVSRLPDDTVTTTTRTVITDDALRGAGIDELRAADVTRLGIDPVTAGALAGAGVDTSVGALVGVTTAELAGALVGRGANVSTGDLRVAVATARLANAVKGLGR